MTDTQLKNRAAAAIRGRAEDIIELAKEYALAKDKRIQMLYDKVTASKIRIEDLEKECSRHNDENLRLRYGLGRISRWDCGGMDAADFADQILKGGENV